VEEVVKGGGRFRSSNRRQQGDLDAQADDDALMRKTIETQLEVASSPAFASIALSF
jgi:hypothetical protein